MNFEDESEWTQLSPEEKKKQLYLKQVQTLNDFLERNAISKEQYEKSLHDLTEKMGMSAQNSIGKNSTLLQNNPTPFFASALNRPMWQTVWGRFVDAPKIVASLQRIEKNLCSIQKSPRQAFT